MARTRPSREILIVGGDELVRLSGRDCTFSQEPARHRQHSPSGVVSLPLVVTSQGPAGLNTAIASPIGSSRTTSPELAPRMDTPAPPSCVPAASQRPSALALRYITCGTERTHSRETVWPRRNAWMRPDS